MIKKIRRKQEKCESLDGNTPSPEEKRHLATKSVHTWYQEHGDTSVYSKRFNHKLNTTTHQEDSK